jgi:hypothetical protein
MPVIALAMSSGYDSKRDEYASICSHMLPYAIQSSRIVVRNVVIVEVA